MEIKVIDGVTFVEGDYRKAKRALSDAQLRLLAAFVAVLVIITLYAYIGIQFASASDMFIPK